MTTTGAPAAAGSGSAVVDDAAAVRQLVRLAWRRPGILLVLAGLLSALGFVVTTPPERLATLAGDVARDRATQAQRDADQDSAIARERRRVDRQEELLRSNNRAWCVTLSARDAKLAGLDCADVGRGR